MSAKTWDCAHRGHHYHELDGTVFARERDPLDTTIYDVKCCHCGKQGAMIGYAAKRGFVQDRSVLCLEPKS